MNSHMLALGRANGLRKPRMLLRGTGAVSRQARQPGRVLRQAQHRLDSAWEQKKLDLSACNAQAEARKYSKMPQNPTRRVHALLGGFCLLKEKSVREEVAQVLL
jgi:hypothetical protein